MGSIDAYSSTSLGELFSTILYSPDPYSIPLTISDFHLLSLRTAKAIPSFPLSRRDSAPTNMRKSVNRSHRIHFCSPDHATESQPRSIPSFRGPSLYGEWSAHAAVLWARLDLVNQRTKPRRTFPRSRSLLNSSSYGPQPLLPHPCRGLER